MTGWIKLHRKILDNGIIKRDHNAYILFSIILLSVDKSTGKLDTGRFLLSDLSGLNPNTVYAVLKRLEKKWQMITLTPNNKYTIINVRNWAKYQETENLITQSDNNKITTRQQQDNTIQEYKNKEYKKKKNVMPTFNDFKEFSTIKGFGNRNLEEEWEKINNWIEANKRTIKVYKNFWLNWLKKTKPDPLIEEELKKQSLLKQREDYEKKIKDEKCQDATPFLKEIKKQLIEKMSI